MFSNGFSYWLKSFIGLLVFSSKCGIKQRVLFGRCNPSPFSYGWLGISRTQNLVRSKRWGVIRVVGFSIKGGNRDTKSEMFLPKWKLLKIIENWWNGKLSKLGIILAIKSMKWFKNWFYQKMSITKNVLLTTSFFKLVQCQPQLNHKIQQFVVEGVYFTHTEPTSKGFCHFSLFKDHPCLKILLKRGWIRHR